MGAMPFLADEAKSIAGMARSCNTQASSRCVPGGATTQEWRRSCFHSTSPWPSARASTRARTNSRSDSRLR